jgi:hypothetical protein
MKEWDRNRRPDLPKRACGVRFPRVPALRVRKKENIRKWDQTHEEGPGNEALFESPVNTREPRLEVWALTGPK